MSKTKVVVIGSGKNAERFFEENSQNEFIDIIGTIPDKALNCEKIKSQYKGLLSKCDLGFTLGYNRIIPSDICDNYFIINLHAGILPKWRGFSANAWAIMNGENEIGYSLHRVNNDLDGGLLYYVKHISIGKEQTISDVHDEMINSIVRECPKKLYEIFNGQIKNQKQTDINIAYCTRFNAKMGIINDYNKNADYYVNLYRCMAKPVGSGLYFYYHEEMYSVDRIEHGKKYGSIDYLCSEGKIVNIHDGNLWVKVKDNVIVLSGVKKGGKNISLDQCFINGSFLGENKNA